ncbi:MAG: alpha/beta hydrolase [Ignavibacteriales bacterium]|nr:alpha/beta hydrolase [Ignavibacteriales bacterium]
MTEPRKKRGSFFLSLAIAGVVAILFWSVVLMIFEEKFIYFPAVYPDGVYESEARALQPEDHWFTTDDGVKLHAWSLRSDSAAPTVIHFHGNAGNLSHRGEILRRLHASGFNVFIFDYRGYGKSEGSPDEEGVYKDGLAAFDYVSGLSGIDRSSIVLFGTSLGGAVAVEVAARKKPVALILESTFSSARDVAAAAYPYLPARWLLRTKFDSESKIRSLTIPLLFIHGTDDSIIPFELGRKLYEAANEPKEFYTVEGADHNNVFLIGGREHQRRIKEFVESVVHDPRR